jgi:hypothetical protein
MAANDHCGSNHDLAYVRSAPCGHGEWLRRRLFARLPSAQHGGFTGDLEMAREIFALNSRSGGGSFRAQGVAASGHHARAKGPSIRIELIGRALSYSGRARHEHHNDLARMGSYLADPVGPAPSFWPIVVLLPSGVVVAVLLTP